MIDLVVSTLAYRAGAVHVLLMNSDGSVESTATIDRDTPGLHEADDLDGFGTAHGHRGHQR